MMPLTPDENQMLLVASIALDILWRARPDLDRNEIMYQFTSSQTYADLFVEEYKWWVDGPCVIAQNYLREINDEIGLKAFD